MTRYQRKRQEQTARTFVLSKFPEADVIYLLFWFVVVPIKDEYKFTEFIYYPHSDNIYLGRKRTSSHMAWISAKKELEKYEQGGKPTPFLETLTR